MRRTTVTFIVMAGLMAILFSDDWDTLSNRRSAKIVDSISTVYCVPAKTGEQHSSADVLKTGTYNVKIAGGENNTGTDNGEYTVQIVVISPFWRTWWFKSLIILLMAGILYKLYRTRQEAPVAKTGKGTKLERFFSKYNISTREQEVTILILQGESKKNIEDKLYISSHTVKNHIYNIYRKLGIKNRLQLLHIVQEFQ